jgi:hypothetical protein
MNVNLQFASPASWPMGGFRRQHATQQRSRAAALRAQL